MGAGSIGRVWQQLLAVSPPWFSRQAAYWKRWRAHDSADVVELTGYEDASIFQGCRPELHHPLVEASTVLDSMAARDCHKLRTYRISDYRGNLAKGGTSIPA